IDVNTSGLGHGKISIEILSTGGQPLLKKYFFSNPGNISIDLHGFSSGMYLIKAESGNVKKTGKFIIR
ncbi:MAG TPA: T9SS type A sorting domain-containing protein, partial [Bacteroidales bacterium]|nr:T9SS type A sorting domain-containing protein [Bacteroidales bacterium]